MTWDYGAIPAFAAHLYADERGIFFAAAGPEHAPVRPQGEHTRGDRQRPAQGKPGMGPGLRSPGAGHQHPLPPRAAGPKGRAP